MYYAARSNKVKALYHGFRRPDGHKMQSIIGSKNSISRYSTPYPVLHDAHFLKRAHFGLGHKPRPLTPLYDSFRRGELRRAITSIRNPANTSNLGRTLVGSNMFHRYSHQQSRYVPHYLGLALSDERMLRHHGSSRAHNEDVTVKYTVVAATFAAIVAGGLMVYLEDTEGDSHWLQEVVRGIHDTITQQKLEPTPRGDRIVAFMARRRIRELRERDTWAGTDNEDQNICKH